MTLMRTALMFTGLVLFLGTVAPIQQAQAGKLKEINFKVKATAEQRKFFKDGFVPWISIQNPKKDIARLDKANEIVIKAQKVTLVIDYPLGKPAHFILQSPKGFTRAALALLISKKYHEIYQTEERTARQKTIPLKQRKGIINRNQTDGKYHIWGHDIGDLDLSSIDVIRKNGKIYLELGVES